MTDTGTIKKLIEDRNANLMKWYAEGAVDKVAEVFSEDCWQMQPNSEPLVGREALRKGWRQLFDWGKCDFSLKAQDVLVSGFIAVERGKYVFRFSAGPDAPDEMSSYEDKGSYVALWKRENDGEWRLFWDAPVSELAIPRAT